MADRNLNQEIIDAYKASIRSKKYDVLSWVKTFAVLGQQSSVQDWYGLTPLVLINPLTSPVLPDVFEGQNRCEQITFNVQLLCILQLNKQSYAQRPARVPDKTLAMQRATQLDDIFGRETFGLSGVATTNNVNYDAPVPGIQVGGNIWVHAVSIDISHLYYRRSYL